MLSQRSDSKHVDNNSPGLMLSLITVSLLKQDFCLYKFPLHTRWGMGRSQATKTEKDAKVDTLQGYVRGAYLYSPSHWYFPLLGNKCSLFKGHAISSFYALLHCMKKAAAVMASASRPCDLTASESTGLTQIPLRRCGVISVGNSSVSLCYWMGQKHLSDIALSHPWPVRGELSNSKSD